MARSTSFEDVRVVGGPSGRSVEVWVGGEKVPGLSHAELYFDVNDVVRLKTTKIVFANYEGQAVVHPSYHLKVHEIFEAGYEMIAEATADTVWEALYDCARQLELTARRNGQGVAQAGTIVEPTGRPPDR